jgi:1-acyl-sn-glycerol-3-phosphate acyltransferase
MNSRSFCFRVLAKQANRVAKIRRLIPRAGGQTAPLMKLIIAILRPFIWLLCRVMFRIRFEGLDNVPPRGACVIVPNHITFADPIWVTIPLRRRVYYMAWDRPFQIPVLGFLMRVFGAFPVRLDAVDASAQREAIDLLGQGKALVIFPEGGRTRSGDLMQFKPGAFRLALTLGVPIVPVAISGAYEIWPASRLLPRPGRLKVQYLPRIDVDQVPQEITNAQLKLLSRNLAVRTTDQIRVAVSSSAECGMRSAE